MGSVVDQIQKMHILYIDSYDSFANNIVGLLESSLRVPVTMVKMDDMEVASSLESFLSGFTAVVVGPGPGDPRNLQDIGFINRLWKLDDSSLLPILGICLGFQSLALAFGSSIERLRYPRHGVVTEVVHQGADIFESNDSFQATQYHSLSVNLGHQSTNDPSNLWTGAASCPMLKPLAWDFSDDLNGPVLQALRHKTKPYWGLQYHPESICTSGSGAKVVFEWWMKSLEWLKSQGEIRKLPHIVSNGTNGENLLTRPPLTNSTQVSELERGKLEVEQIAINTCRSWVSPWHIQSREFPLGQLNVVQLCEVLNIQNEEMILLDSQETKGRFSILGLIIPGQTLKLSFTVQNRQLRISVDGQMYYERFLNESSQIWSLLEGIMDCSTSYGDDNPSPFCGGLMGYISYEAGLDTIQVFSTPQESLAQRPDINVAFIQRSAVIDHVSRRIYIQSLLANDTDWLSETSAALGFLAQAKPSTAATPSSFPECSPIDGLRGTIYQNQVLKYFQSGIVECPAESQYRESVVQCQEALHAGDSYEICLTNQTTVTLPKDALLDQPWILYKDLRCRNPAPFGGYIRLGGSTIMSSSPERFLSWDRMGNCQMRPIKGTVKKSEDMTYDRAKALLNTSKERAENLMIVDLIRHDISGVIGAQNTIVSSLMQVEEYETVYQLVSVIEGRVPSGFGVSSEDVTRYRSQTEKNDKVSRPSGGLQILKAALPPGSMTGAPKKRSCELLQTLEKGKPRGIYSGVLGYMDVRGGGDFSVVIRTVFRQDDEIVWKKRPSCGRDQEMASTHDERVGCEKSAKRTDVPHESMTPYQVWRIGAGGAITVQSTDQGEFEEMQTKLESVLRIFHPT